MSGFSSAEPCEFLVKESACPYPGDFIVALRNLYFPVSPVQTRTRTRCRSVSFHSLLKKDGSGLPRAQKGVSFLRADLLVSPVSPGNNQVTILHASVDVYVASQEK